MGINENDRRFRLTRKETKSVIKNCIKDGKRYFITGMALGFETMCAEIILGEKMFRYFLIYIFFSIVIDKTKSNTSKNRLRAMENAEIDGLIKIEQIF